MKFKYLIIKFIFLFIYPTILIAAESKIVFIDMDFLMNNSKVGKYINKEIENKQKLNQTNFKKAQEKIKKMDDEIKSQKNILSEEEVKNKISKLNNEIKLYQEELQKKRTEINNIKLNTTSEILENLKPILTEYAKKNQISLILKKNDVIIGKNELNITDDILTILDNKITKIDIKL